MSSPELLSRRTPLGASLAATAAPNQTDGRAAGPCTARRRPPPARRLRAPDCLEPQRLRALLPLLRDDWSSANVVQGPCCKPVGLMQPRLMVRGCRQGSSIAGRVVLHRPPRRRDTQNASNPAVKGLCSRPKTLGVRRRPGRPRAAPLDLPVARPIANRGARAGEGTGQAPSDLGQAPEPLGPGRRRLQGRLCPGWPWMDGRVAESAVLPEFLRSHVAEGRSRPPHAQSGLEGCIAEHAGCCSVR